MMRLLIAFTTLCFILKVCVLVQGGYIVEVRLNGYSNPTGKCGEQACRSPSGQLYCCDKFTETTNCIGTNLCDSYFTYCLRPFGEVRLNCSQSDQSRARSSINMNDGPLDFSKSRVLGLDNPQTLSGLGGVYNGVQLYIEIGDSDQLFNFFLFGRDEVVDILLLNLNLTVAESLRQNHTGIYNLVSMDLTITVLCERGFQGADCTQCVSGFTGPNCDIIDRCFGLNCSGNGECINNAGLESFTCICDQGYKGELCENIDCLSNNCSGNGWCMDRIRNSPSRCVCSTGFTGSLCETNIDDCLSNPCVGEGRCVDGVGSSQCICDPGFTGELCQTNISDDCVGVNCSGNRRCVDEVNNFTCECTPGFSGPLCSESDSIMTSTDGSRLQAGVLGGGISGALSLMIVLLLLTTCCTVALCWTRKSRKITVNYNCDQPLQEQVYDEIIIDKQPNSNHFELKNNEAYISTTHYIPSEDSVYI